MNRRVLPRPPHQSMVYTPYPFDSRLTFNNSQFEDNRVQFYDDYLKAAEEYDKGFVKQRDQEDRKSVV